MGTERRGADRVFVRLPVLLEDGSIGVTIDANANGVLFESGANCVAGSEINFMLTFQNPECTMVCNCKGLVVRVEPRGEKAGIAARIVESRFLPMPLSDGGAAHVRN